MTLEAVSSSNDLEEYLGFLYGSETGYVYCPTRDFELDPKAWWKQYFFKWPDEKAKVIEHITTFAPANKLDVYCSPALFTAPDAHKEFVKGSYLFWCEHDDGRIPVGLEEKGIPRPSMVINSSEKNEHWYWKCDEFNTDINLIERINRGIAYSLGADASGWDINQVLRPPGSYNYKRNYAATLSVSSPWTINPSAFNALPTPPKVDVEYGDGDLLDNALIIAKYQWDKDTFNFFRTREIGQGSRSTALMRLAYTFCEMGMVDQEIVTLLYSADERWGKFRGRKDRMHRLNEMVAFARIKHPFSNLLQVVELPVFGFQDFMETEVHIEWVINGMLEQTGQMILSSKPGVGKTQLSLRFFMALATGQRILHYDIMGQKKIIFFSFEMGHAQLKYFLEQMAELLTKDQREILQKNFLIVPLGEALYLGNSKGQKLIEDLLAKHEPDGYCIDSLSRTTPGSTSDEEQIKTILDWDARIRNQTNTFSWYIHHNRKSTIGNKKPKSLDDLIGSTVIQANTSSVYTMWRQQEDSFSPIEIINVKQRLGIMEPTYLITRGANLTFTESKMRDQEATEKVSSALGLPVIPGDDEETIPSLPDKGMTF